MGREVRRVPADWVHPKGISLFDGKDFDQRVIDWDNGAAKWREGLKHDYFTSSWVPLDGTEEAKTYEEWDGERPDAKDYMPVWSDVEATHFMMYETTSEGSPISPAFATPEELARWLADNNASAFADQTADYESWLRVAKGGYACSAVIENRQLVSGVEGLTEKE